MARARNIKPSFFISEQTSENCPLGRLLFIGLWTLADYKGELEWREKTIKIQILPWDDCDIKKLAINLDKSGLIRFYSDGNKVYINIPNFEKHQNPHKNEKLKGSEIPVYSKEYRQLIDLKGLTINRDKSGAKPECSQSDPADPLILIPDPLSLIPDKNTLVDTGVSTDSADDSNTDKPPSCPHTEIIAAYHEILPELDSVVVSLWKPSTKRYKWLQARWRESDKHQSVEFWRRFFKALRNYPFYLGTNDRCWKANLEWMVKQENFIKLIEKFRSDAKRQ